MENASKNQLHIIKKYPNRRLYDMCTSTYITLSEIRDLITDAKEFKVIDSKTNQDLTRHILLQIILEEENGKRPLFSRAVLIQLIKFYKHPLQQLLGLYLEKDIQLFIDIKRKLTEQMSVFPNQYEQLASLEIPIMEKIIDDCIIHRKNLLTKTQVQLDQRLEEQVLSNE